MSLYSPIKQIEMFPEGVDRKDTTSTFLDNLALPIHRWFRYSAGFSALWVRDLIQQQRACGRHHILDPFAGSGTVLLEGELCEVETVGIEAHPFISRVAQAKLCWRANLDEFRRYALSILEHAQELGGDISQYPPLIKKCFPTESLARLDTLQKSWAAVADESPHSELTWLALASIIRECSPVGTAQWQYVLPNKMKAKAVDPYEAFSAKVQMMRKDIATRQKFCYGPQARVYRGDTRERPPIPEEWADLIITSPPYANNYDYADATRLEMSFFGDIQGWGDLQEAVRKYLVPSCTQHVANMTRNTQALIGSQLLQPIQEELAATCRLLEAERAEHGGKKLYHTMIAAYFHDMAKAWIALRRVTREKATVCFVVGDSAPYGIYVPVDKWLGELALAAGFKSYRFEKTRDRNIKWKNRKHRVPLHEGRLWIEG